MNICQYCAFGSRRGNLYEASVVECTHCTTVMYIGLHVYVTWNWVT